MTASDSELSRSHIENIARRVNFPNDLLHQFVETHNFPVPRSVAIAFFTAHGFSPSNMIGDMGGSP